MQIIKKFDKQANYIFFGAIIIHLLIMCVEFGNFSVPFRGRLLQIAFCLCGLKILMTYYTKLQWIVMLLLGIVGTISYVFTREKYVLYVLVLVFAAKAVDMRKILKVVLYTSIVALIAVAACSALGVGGQLVDVRDYGRGAIESRYCFGFGHANNFHSAVWYIVSIAIWVYKDVLDWKHYTIMTVGNIAIFCLTVSRTGFIATEMIIILGVLYRYAAKVIYDNVWIYIAGGVAYFTVIALSIAAITICGWDGYGPVLGFVDKLTTGRVMLAYKYARLQWWHIWSRSGVENPILDNGFVALGINFGYVVCIVYIAFVAYLLYITAKNKNGILFALVLINIFYTYMENSFVLNYVYLLCNFSYLVAMMILGESNEQKANSNIKV